MIWLLLLIYPAIGLGVGTYFATRYMEEGDSHGNLLGFVGMVALTWPVTSALCAKELKGRVEVVVPILESPKPVKDDRNGFPEAPKGTPVLPKVSTPKTPSFYYPDAGDIWSPDLIEKIRDETRRMLSLYYELDLKEDAYPFETFCKDMLAQQGRPTPSRWGSVSKLGAPTFRWEDIAIVNDDWVPIRSLPSRAIRPSKLSQGGVIDGTYGPQTLEHFEDKIEYRGKMVDRREVVERELTRNRNAFML